MPRLQVRDFKTCLRFDGVAAKVDLGAVAAFQPAALTVAGWVKPERNIGGTTMRLASNLVNSAGSWYGWEFDYTGQSVYAQASYGGSLHGGAAAALRVGRWQFVAFTADGAGHTITYVNGLPIITDTQAGALTYTTVQHTYLGWGSQGGFFQGSLDGWRIWGRVLTPAELLALYESETVPSADLAGEWLLDEASGLVALDSSGNGRNGVISVATYSHDVPMRSRLPASLAHPVATLSGNEITDLTRALASEGDGRDADDATTGIWQATTNLAAGKLWTAGGGGVVTPGASPNKFGSSSALQTGVGIFSRVDLDTVHLTIGHAYKVTTWLYRTETVENLLFLFAEGDAAQRVTPAATLGWQKLVLPFTPLSTGDYTLRVQKFGGAGDILLYIDDLPQIEESALATPVARTSRSAGRIRIPTAGIVGASQGWAVFRARAGAAGTALGSSPAFFVLAADASNYLEVWWRVNAAWAVNNIGAGNNDGVVLIADAFAADAHRTVAASWSLSQYRLSLNGSAWAGPGARLHPWTTPAALMEVGSEVNLGGTGYWNGDFYWAAFGSGVLDPTDPLLQLDAVPNLRDLIRNNGGLAVPTAVFDGATQRLISNIGSRVLV